MISFFHISLVRVWLLQWRHHNVVNIQSNCRNPWFWCHITWDDVVLNVTRRRVNDCHMLAHFLKCFIFFFKKQLVEKGYVINTIFNSVSYYIPLSCFVYQYFSTQIYTFVFELRHEKMCLRRSPTRLDTNWPAQQQRPARILKFRIYKLVVSFCLGSEQQRRWTDCADAQADLRLCCSHMA